MNKKLIIGVLGILYGISLLITYQIGHSGYMMTETRSIPASEYISYHYHINETAMMLDVGFKVMSREKVDFHVLSESQYQNWLNNESALTFLSARNKGIYDRKISFSQNSTRRLVFINPSSTIDIRVQITLHYYQASGFNLEHSILLMRFTNIIALVGGVLIAIYKYKQLDNNEFFTNQSSVNHNQKLRYLFQIYLVNTPRSFYVAGVSWILLAELLFLSPLKPPDLVKYNPNSLLPLVLFLIGKFQFYMHYIAYLISSIMSLPLNFVIEGILLGEIGYFMWMYNLLLAILPVIGTVSLTRIISKYLPHPEDVKPYVWYHFKHYSVYRRRFDPTHTLQNEKVPVDHSDSIYTLFSNILQDTSKDNHLQITKVVATVKKRPKYQQFDDAAIKNGFLEFIDFLGEFVYDSNHQTIQRIYMKKKGDVSKVQWKHCEDGSQLLTTKLAIFKTQRYTRIFVTLSCIFLMYGLYVLLTAFINSRNDWFLSFIVMLSLSVFGSCLLAFQFVRHLITIRGREDISTTRKNIAIFLLIYFIALVNIIITILLTKLDFTGIPNIIDGEIFILFFIAVEIPVKAYILNHLLFELEYHFREENYRVNFQKQQLHIHIKSLLCKNLTKTVNLAKVNSIRITEKPINNFLLTGIAYYLPQGVFKIDKKLQRRKRVWKRYRLFVRLANQPADELICITSYYDIVKSIKNKIRLAQNKY